MGNTPQQGDNDKAGEQVQAQQGLSDTPQEDTVIKVVDTTSGKFAEFFKTGKIDPASF